MEYLSKNEFRVAELLKKNRGTSTAAWIAMKLRMSASAARSNADSLVIRGVARKQPGRPVGFSYAGKKYSSTRGGGTGWSLSSLNKKVPRFLQEYGYKCSPPCPVTSTDVQEFISEEYGAFVSRLPDTPDFGDVWTVLSDDFTRVLKVRGIEVTDG